MRLSVVVTWGQRGSKEPVGLILGPVLVPTALSGFPSERLNSCVWWRTLWQLFSWMHTGQTPWEPTGAEESHPACRTHSTFWKEMILTES